MQPCVRVLALCHHRYSASALASIAASAMPEMHDHCARWKPDRGAVSEEAIDHVMQLARKATVIAIGSGLSAADERTRRFVFPWRKSDRFRW